MPWNPGGQANTELQREPFVDLPRILHIFLNRACTEIRPRTGRTLRIGIEDPEYGIRIAVVRVQRVIRVLTKREIAGESTALIALPGPAAGISESGLDAVLAENLRDVVREREDRGSSADRRTRVVRETCRARYVTEAHDRQVIVGVRGRIPLA